MNKILFTCLFSAGCLAAKEGDLAHLLGLRKLTEAKDIEAFFPKGVEEIEERKRNMISGFNSALKQLLEEKKHSFEKTAYFYDLAFGALNYGTETLSSLSMVSPDSKVREAAEKASTEVAKAGLKALSEHPELYQAIASIKTEDLTDEEKYFVEEIKKQLESLGLNLPLEKRMQVKQLQEELLELGEQFNRNIREDQRHIIVSQEDLLGMDSSFIKSLATDEKGGYILTTDYPIVFPVLDFCRVEKTRRQMLKLFSQKGHPQNDQILKQISQKRHALAKILGFDSYAHLQLSMEMVEHPSKATAFLTQMAEKLKLKQQEEFKLLKNDLPEGVSLNALGQIEPWNLNYAIAQYKKKHFDLDEEALKVYFPLETTLKGLMQVYEKFFDIKIEQLPAPNLWHQDLRLLKVSSQNGKRYGFIVLDLHPRKGKYTHACDAPLHPSLKSQNEDVAALSMLICNFPKGKEKEPSLMRPSDVRTFFHEFGHALHDMLGGTALISTAGTNTKRDFVELPSQMLEEWLWDPEILKMVSSHYLTKENLPDSIIKKMVEAKNAFIGTFLMRQIMLSHYALNFHLEPCLDLGALWRNLEKSLRPEIAPMEDNYFFLSFGHLYGYGACYYGYLWSKVFALDVFEKIKEEGLLNPKIGKSYIDQIIGRGGSLNPNRLLLNFLGRKPTQEAFFKSIGLDLAK